MRTHVRDVSALWPLRGRYPSVLICLDDPSPYEEQRPELEELGAKLVVEAEPGPVSERLGRPSVTVCDRFLEVAVSGDQPAPQEVVAVVRSLELRCEECPQAAVDTGTFVTADPPSE
jgi:hypothetical protein